MITYTVGVDIGGTFTDIVCAGSDGSFRLMKRPTTRGDPAAAVRDAVAAMRADWGIEPSAIERFVHGSTVATNAVLERTGAKTGIITTAGFKDVLEIGRQMRHRMYDLVLTPETPIFLAPGARRKEVRERVAADGSVVTPLDEDDVRRAAAELAADGVAAVAIVFLFSFLNPAHERRAAQILREAHPEIALSLSSEVDPAFREYERTAVTAFDAYLKPVVAGYIARLEADLAAAGVPAPLQIMQSRGGICAAATAAQRPVRLFLSGPAAGVIGGVAAAKSAGARDLITLDIGGTSCDIALVTGGEPLLRAEGVIDGYTVRVPMVDVTAIGAGGGSIARVDDAGALRVGPQSAGSEPGPACYGRGGTEPTVTDASVVLGYLDPDYFAGGTLRLDAGRARAAIAPLAERMRVSVEMAALGIHRVLNAQMAEAMRLASIGRGFDPRGYTLVPLGGGGPIHAAALAAELGIARIVVPAHPGVLSAAGLLAAPVEHELSIAFPCPLAGAEWSPIAAALDSLDAGCAALMRGEGAMTGAVDTRHFADICYIGQGYHLEIAVRDCDAEPLAALYRDFLAAHDRIYGYAAPMPAKIVNLRSVQRAWFAATLPAPPAAATRLTTHRRQVLIDPQAGPQIAHIYRRGSLGPGRSIAGPAIIEQTDTTTLLPAGWRGTVGREGLLLLERL
ncbi:MAG: hydantoinase/oxoprolinase family protein [Alphaproteobacteria bacterium]|nr:hydantoinase/oxoprolinase family protein [Alphaproteobacteria bacterium]